MKVITQLIRHFWQEGALSPEQVEHLIDHGFIRPRDLVGYRSPEAAEDTWVETEAAPIAESDELDRLADRLAVPRRKAKHGKTGPRRNVLQPADLIARVHGVLAERADCLPHLSALAAEFGECEGWDNSLERLRQASVTAFAAQLRAHVHQRPEKLHELWQALDFDPFRKLISDEELRGRAAQAYAVLLVGDPARLGKYNWILAYEAMQVVMNLRRVNELFLKAVAETHRQVPHLITKALAAGGPTLMFWALVLLYNANRTQGDELDFGEEYGPIALPEHAIWQQAWTLALRMEPAAVTQFLIACYAKGDQRNERPALGCQRSLFCPAGWHVPQEP